MRRNVCLVEMPACLRMLALVPEYANNRRNFCLVELPACACLRLSRNLHICKICGQAGHALAEFDKMRLQIETNPPGIVRDRALSLLEHQKERIIAGLAKERRIHTEMLKQLNDAFKVRLMLELEIQRRASIAERKEKKLKQKANLGLTWQQKSTPKASRSASVRGSAT